jgi:hypothetical protein
MPRIAVKNLDKLKKHPREFSLLYELGGTAEGIDSQVTIYGRWPKAQPASLDTRLAVAVLAATCCCSCSSSTTASGMRSSSQ